MVYIEPPVVCVVFQLWEFVLELRNKGFFWGDAGVYYNPLNDFVFLLADDILLLKTYVKSKVGQELSDGPDSVFTTIPL